MTTIPSTQPTPVTVVPPSQREVVIYSHSTLFYWWPVWAVGAVCALLTLIDGHRMALVPRDTTAEASRTVQGHESEGPKDVLIVEKGKLPVSAEDNSLLQPKLFISKSKSLGIVFCTVLLLIIIISNVPLRGLWSVLILLFVVLMVVIFALAGWWDIILEKISLLDIRLNLGAYVYISAILFIIWALSVFVFDHRHYVVVTPGQVRVCLAVGAGETVYDTTGMTFQKQQNDLFRHWIIGLGAGDLIIHRSNTNQEIDMPNVLFIGAKVKEIEQLIKERPVV